MADTQILAAGAAAAPLDYEVPNAQEILLKAVRATFDGTGAAGAFIPCIELISDGGVPLADAIGDQVAAGASADASFFPGAAKAAAAGASTQAAWFFAKRETAQTIPTTAPQQRIAWTHWVTSDPTVFTVQTTLHTDDTVIGNKMGIYYAQCQVGWHPNMTYPGSVDVITDFFGVNLGSNTEVSAATTATDPVGQIRLESNSQLIVTQSVPGEISVRVHNWDAVNHNVDAAYYFIAYWPNAVAVS